MRDGNCIQSDDAWGNNFRFVDVALPSPIDLRDALPLQLCTIYELVAEQTASLGRDRSHHTVGVKHLSSSSIHLDLCAYLNTRDEILMHNCIEKQACAHCVSCEKQIVTVDELRGDVRHARDDSLAVCFDVREEPLVGPGASPDCAATSGWSHLLTTPWHQNEKRP